MKKLLFIFTVLSLSCTSVNGQTNVYNPFPDSNAIWREHFYDNYGQYHYQFGILGDTILKSLTYHKLYRQEPCLNDTAISTANALLVGAIREDSLKKVFFYSFGFGFPESSPDSIYKLYDFSIQLGDTIRYDKNYSFLFPYLVCDSIDSVLTYNHYRKRYFLSTDTWIHAETWIEGIGSLRSLLSGVMGYPTCFCVWENVCYKYLNTTYYLNPPFLDCYDMSHGINPIVSTHQKINISPNPFTQSTQIALDQTYQNITLQVYDILGKLILKKEYARSGNILLQRNGLNNGMYFLKITLDGKMAETRKIIVGK